MYKNFITSDVHSFYTPLKKALDDAGFNINNPAHRLIILGDLFDRGKESVEIYNFVKALPEDRCILVRGNHEYLFLELLKKDFPDSFDFSNGTVRTMCQLIGKPEYEINLRFDLFEGISARVMWKQIRKEVKDLQVDKWIKSDRWVNFWENDAYVGVHSFIPLQFIGKKGGLGEKQSYYSSVVDNFSYYTGWRRAPKKSWSNCAWGCPFTFFDAGLFSREVNKGKKLICGHWASHNFHLHYNRKSTELKLYNHNIYFGEYIIALDATTARSSKCNILVVDDKI